MPEISEDHIMRELDRIHTSMNDLNRKFDDAIANRLSKLEVQMAKVQPENYVTQEQFKPMSRLFWFIVFSFAGLVVSAVGSLVVQQNKPPAISSPPAVQGGK